MPWLLILLSLPCIPPAPLFSRQGFYEGVVRGPEDGNGTASEMQFMVEWTPINVDGSVKVGEPIEEEIEKESIVVKANECYTRWWSCKQQESLKNEQRMEVDGEVAKELAASLAAKGRVEQMEQDTHLGDGGPEAATAVAGEPAATAAAEGRGEQVEQGTHLGDGGPEAATAVVGEPAAAAAAEGSGEQEEQATHLGDEEPEAATAAAGTHKNKCEEEQVEMAVPSKQVRSPPVRSFLPPYDMWGFRSKRRGASAAATCGAIDVYLYPPGETKPVMSKIGVTKWIGQNQGKVTSEDERMVAAMWAAARAACDSVDMKPCVILAT